MSGIVGIVNLDGGLVDARLLQRMTDSLAFRGPDAKATWIEGNVGFGHTLLKTTFESEHEHQPLTLDGKVWIVADARIDAQEELIRNLTSHGRTLPREVTDPELILHAYHTWGEECLDHLLGDFAFGIWDGPRQCLFCARDQMGVKPFLYAHIGPIVIFSNTLDCIRLHPAVSDRLNDLAIADFLVYEVNQDVATTAFADIQRLAPAHFATWSGTGLRLRRYWTLPIDEPVFYRREGDYVDRFKELLRQAVTDRLRTSRVGIFMSGGLDSSTLAATAGEILRTHHGTAGLKAFTHALSYGPAERHYAGLVASHVGIPIKFLTDEENLFETNCEHRSIHTPEPVKNPWEEPGAEEMWRYFGAHSRVFFYGEGPDNALRFEWQPWFRYLWRQFQGSTPTPPFSNQGQDGRAIWCGRFLQSFFSVVAHGPIPFLGRISNKIAALRSGGTSGGVYPGYLNPELESRLGLRARWAESQRPCTSAHPVRPKGHASLLIPLWQALFGEFDVAATKALVEIRQPFLDLRLLQFMLSVPTLPWCRSKYLVRRAMRGLLPQPVLNRKKEGVYHGPAANRANKDITFPIESDPDLSYYVDGENVPNNLSDNVGNAAGYQRVYGLNYWLQNSRKSLDVTLLEDNKHEPFAAPADRSFGQTAV